MTKFAVLLLLTELVVFSNSFFVSTCTRFRVRTLSEKISEPASVDPNFEAHLASFLKVGSKEDRPEPDIGADLRKRFKDIEGNHHRFFWGVVAPDSSLSFQVEVEKLPRS